MRMPAVKGLSIKLLILPLVFGIAALAVAGDSDIEIAEGSSCTSRCYAQEQACMQATKGSAQCNAQLIRCLQGCR